MLRVAFVLRSTEVIPVFSDLFTHPTRTQSPDAFVKSWYRFESATPPISTYPGARGIAVARLRRSRRRRRRRSRPSSSRPSLSSSRRLVVHEGVSRDESSSCKTGRRHAKLVPLSSHDERSWPPVARRGGPCRRAKKGFMSSRDGGIRDAAARRDAPSLGEPPCRATRGSDEGRRCAHDMWALVAHRRVTMGVVGTRRRALSHDENGSYGFLRVPMDSTVFLWIPQCPHGFLSVPMDASLSPWIPHCSHGSRSVPMDSLVFPWIPQCSHGFLSVPMDSSVFPWIPHCSHGFLTVPMGPSLFLWIPQGSNGFLNIPMDSLVFLLIPQCSHGFMYVPMGSSMFLWIP